MTNQPGGHRVLPVRRWLAPFGAAILLMAAVASPWAVGSAAQSGSRSTSGTPRAPVVIRSTSRVRIISSDGTPRPTATLPTESEPGTPIPPATAYHEAGGGATVPESTSGHELRLYRLTIDPQTTFDLPESTGWTIVGFSGTVDFYPAFAGQRSEDSTALTAQSETGGPLAGTFQNLSDAPAVVWVIGVAATDTPDPATPAGVVMERVGAVTLPHLTAGARVAIHYSFAAAGPVAGPLDPSLVSPNRRVGDATGSVPVGVVYGVQGSIQITDTAGGDPVAVQAGESVDLDDLTTRSVMGPAQRATDPPNSYIVVSAREQAAQPGMTGTPGALVERATPLAASSSPVGSPVSGDVVVCDAEPRTVEELQAAIDLLYATPTLLSDPSGRSARSQAGTGSSADGATVAAIESTLEEYAVCSANGDIARALGLVSDDYVAFILGNILSDLADLPQYATARPASSGVPVELVIADVEQFADGRAGALVYASSGAAYFTFSHGEAGAWLIDAVDQESGQGSIATGSVTIPES